MDVPASSADGCSAKDKDLVIWEVEVSGNLGMVGDDDNLGKDNL